jgi:protein-L-isoaspartate O-methyltransferase
VTAIEDDAELAARATANLAQTPHVRAVHGCGTQIAFEPADVTYVNAGATRPADAWLDRLKEGGRLILPLTADGTRSRTCGHRTSRTAGYRRGSARCGHEHIVEALNFYWACNSTFVRGEELCLPPLARASPSGWQAGCHTPQRSGVG